MPFQLCYASTATRAFTRDDLLQILAHARQHNAEQGITGLLLFQDGHFLQVLEGEAAPIRALFKQICKDERHHRIALLFEEFVSQHQYPDWSMGFQAMDGTEWMEFPQEDSHQRDIRTLAQTMGRAKELLMYIRKQGLDPSKDIL